MFGIFYSLWQEMFHDFWDGFFKARGYCNIKADCVSPQLIGPSNMTRQLTISFRCFWRKFLCALQTTRFFANPWPYLWESNSGLDCTITVERDSSISLESNFGSNFTEVFYIDGRMIKSHLDMPDTLAFGTNIYWPLSENSHQPRICFFETSTGNYNSY